jgi:predicted transposase
MITIKLPYTTENIEDSQSIVDNQKQYSTVLRSVYNRKMEGMSDKEVRAYMKTLSYKHPVNCWLIESALYEAKALIDSKDSLKSKDKIIFGSKKQFNRRTKGLISNEEYKKSRLSKFYSVGQANQKGNRFFTLNIIDDNEVIFKPSRGVKIKLKLPNLSPNYKKY